jgi:hypothetical protein
VDSKRSNGNRGGRPHKKEEERATIKLNCWVTPNENRQLQAEYLQIKAGKKLVFAHFLKQVLLAKKQTNGPKPDELLLTLIINLQDRGRELEAIKDLLNGQQQSCSCEKINGKISNELEKIQETITQIATWLYES